MVSRRAFVILVFAAMVLVPSASAGVQLDPAVVPPSPPMNVQETSGSDTVTISWDPPVFMGGASSVTYRVYKDDAVIADGLTTTSYIVHLPVGMSAAVAANYYVSAQNDAGESLKVGGGPCIDLEHVIVDPGNCVALAWAAIWWVVGQIPPV